MPGVDKYRACTRWTGRLLVTGRSMLTQSQRLCQQARRSRRCQHPSTTKTMSGLHDSSIERNNVLGDRSCVRQSRYFREYESGNNVKALLGTENLCWSTTKKEGVFDGHTVFDGRTKDTSDAETAPRFGRRASRDQLQAPTPVVTQAAAPAAASRRPGASSFDPTGDALWSAVTARDLTEVQRLLRSGGDPNMICPDGWVREEHRPKDGGVGRSLLHHAAWAGDLDVFKCLVTNGADVDRRRNNAWRPNGGVAGRGPTPLHHAVMYNREKIVLFLLDEMGCDINAAGEQASVRARHRTHASRRQRSRIASFMRLRPMAASRGNGTRHPVTPHNAPRAGEIIKQSACGLLSSGASSQWCFFTAVKGM